MQRRRKKQKLDPERKARIVEEARKRREARAQGYRERALKLFPHVCARCGREYSGKDLYQLTVHHKDHDHHNNPPDGSNWELLCVYCHDAEHQDPTERTASEKSPQAAKGGSDLGYQAFEGLKDLLPPEEGGE